jgi:hypothetical protein
MSSTDRRCLRCKRAIPSSKRQGTRFCKQSCRINHHIATHPAKLVDLNAVEAGLLIDAALPWHPTLGDPPVTDQGQRILARFVVNTCRPGDPPPQIPRPEAERIVDRARKAARRLAALGLVRIGMLGRRTVIERTEAGAELLARRHNELYAKAEHVGEAVPTKEENWDYLRELIRTAHPAPRTRVLTVHDIDWHRHDWLRERRERREDARETLHRMAAERKAAGHVLSFGEWDTDG